MGKYADAIKKSQVNMSPAQIRAAKCQRTKERNAARRKKNLENMTETTPRPWTLHKQTYTNHGAAAKTAAHYKSKKQETRIMLRPNGRFGVKHRELV